MLLFYHNTMLKNICLTYSSLYNQTLKPTVKTPRYFPEKKTVHGNRKITMHRHSKKLILCSPGIRFWKLYQDSTAYITRGRGGLRSMGMACSLHQGVLPSRHKLHELLPLQGEQHPRKREPQPLCRLHFLPLHVLLQEVQP